MDKSAVLDRLQMIFDKIFLDPVVVTAELSAEQVDEWDSLLHISIVAAVEEEFSIRFRVGEVEGAKNIGEFADLILSRLGKNAVGI